MLPCSWLRVTQLPNVALCSPHCTPSQHLTAQIHSTLQIVLQKWAHTVYSFISGPTDFIVFVRVPHITGNNDLYLYMKLYITTKDWFHYCCFWVNGVLANVNLFAIYPSSCWMLVSRPYPLSWSQYCEAGRQAGRHVETSGITASWHWDGSPSSPLPTWKRKSHVVTWQHL